MSRLDPAAALRAGAAGAQTMRHEVQVGDPKVKVSVAPPVGSGPEAPSEEERALAAARESSPEHRAAREKVVRDFYQNRMGLGGQRCSEDLNTMDLDCPVQIVRLVPPTVIAKWPAEDSAAGNLFDPDRPQTAEATRAASSAGICCDFEVTKELDALIFTAVQGGRVLVMDDSTRNHNLRQRNNETTPAVAQGRMPEHRNGG